MDSLAHSVASSKIVSTPVFYGKRPWPGGPSIQQKWSLPNSMILYIAKNPSSSKVYQKLVQTCKFFFEKNPILIMANFDALENGTKCHITHNELRDCIDNNYECCINIDLNKLSTKIWITRDILIHTHIQNGIATILQKNFRFEILCLCVYDNDIVFDDLKVLVSFARSVYLFENSIKYKNGTTVMFDKILECLSTNIEFFSFQFRKDVSMVNASTIKNILKLQNLENLESFYLYECPDTLSIEDLSAFIKKFEYTKIFLHFASNISEEYKEQLDFLIDEIIESDVPDRVIAYNGQDEEKRKIMKSRFDNNGTTPFNIPDEDAENEEDDDDGFDVENEPVADN
uniref:Uncharacterized protein n=1 Tax=Panagrolaimus davidi TaxID=227884 RepID=A0A914Q7T0_9BILA